MKIKITYKALRESFKCYTACYCNLQSVLSWESPQYYHCSNSGWDCDVYIFGGIAILTGYNYPSSMKHIPYDLCKKYELQALKNIKNQADMDTRNKLIDELLKEIQTLA